MAKKPKYEPHPRLGTKVVPSEKNYHRGYKIEDYLDDMNETDDPSSVKVIEQEEFTNAEGDLTTTQEMYENGFHIEMPEN